MKFWLVAILLCATRLEAATRYVSTSGSDSNSCAASQNIGTPKRNFQGASGALACMAGGDTLLVRGGTYTDWLNDTQTTPIPSGSSWSNKTRIAAYPNGCSPVAPNSCGTAGENVLLRAPNIGTDSFGEVISLRGAQSYIEFDGININQLTTADASAVTLLTSHHIRLQNARIEVSTTRGCLPACGTNAMSAGNSDLASGFFEFINLTVVGGGDHLNTSGLCDDVGGENACQGYSLYLAAGHSLVERCDFSLSTGYQLHMYNGGLDLQANIVRNNVFHTLHHGWYRLASMEITGSNHEIYNNVIYDMRNESPGMTNIGGKGIHLFGGVSTNNKIYNNTIYNVREYGIDLDPSIGTGHVIRNNLVWNADGGGLIDGTSNTYTCTNNLFSSVSGETCTSNQTANPQFANAGGNDFHLTAASTSAIDTGTATGASFSDDKDGVVRPKGVAWDIGAYEYQAMGSGVVYYVNDDGTHGATCAAYRSIATPAATIQAAFYCMSAGDTLLIRAGVYNESFFHTENQYRIPSGSSWTNKIRIANYPNGCSPNAAHSCGSPGELVIIRPTVFIDYNEFSPILATANLKYVEFDGINIDGSGWTGAGAVGFGTQGIRNPDYKPHHIRIMNAEMIGDFCSQSGGQGAITTCMTAGGGSTIGFGAHDFDPGQVEPIGFFEMINLKIHGAGQYYPDGPTAGSYNIYVSGPNNLVENCVLYDAWNWSIHVYNGSGESADNNIIRNNTIYGVRVGQDPGHRLGGIAFTGQNNQAYNNVVYNITDGADGPGCLSIYLGDNNVYYNNTCYNLSVAAASITGGGNNNSFRNNIGYSTNGGFLGGGTGTIQSNNVTTNPEFVNAGAANFHLAAASGPAYNTGTPVTTSTMYGTSVSTDKDGIARPQAGSWDVGAYEFAGSSLPVGAPINLVPIANATGVAFSPLALSWTFSPSGATPTSYDVYLGTYSGVGTAAFGDMFTRADSGDLGATYTPATMSGFASAAIVGNKVRSTDTTLDTLEVQSQTLGAGQWSQATLATFTGAGQVAGKVLLRMNGDPASPSGYTFSALRNIGGVTSWITRMDSGGETILASESATTWAATDIIRATAVDSTLSLYRCTPTCTTPLLTVTDTGYAAGAAGLAAYSSSSLADVELDDYSSGNMGPPFVVNQAGTSYSTTGVSSTQYYWRIVSRTSIDAASSATLSFTTTGGAVPACATGINPATGTTGVQINPALNWSAVATATAYDVYFGTAATPPLWLADSGVLNAFPGPLANSTVYYWYPRPKNSNGAAVSCTVNTFTTVPVAVPATGVTLRMKK
jgi:hypothetical protein